MAFGHAGAGRAAAAVASDSRRQAQLGRSRAERWGVGAQLRRAAQRAGGSMSGTSVRRHVPRTARTTADLGAGACVVDWSRDGEEEEEGSWRLRFRRACERASERARRSVRRWQQRSQP
jgi:hypothetical protein